MNSYRLNYLRVSIYGIWMRIWLIASRYTISLNIPHHSIARRYNRRGERFLQLLLLFSVFRTPILKPNLRAKINGRYSVSSNWKLDIVRFVTILIYAIYRRYSSRWDLCVYATNTSLAELRISYSLSLSNSRKEFRIEYSWIFCLFFLLKKAHKILD